MPEIILNAAGITRTTGTANPVISGTTGKSGSFSDIPTGTEIAYVRRYSSNKPGFENCIGIWRLATNTIERTSVEKSSNDGDPVVWGVGEQTIDATITPDMIVADDDPRLDTVEPGELGGVDEIDGTETWIASQDGEGIDLTAEQVLGTPFIQKSGHATIKRLREYSDFTRIRPAFASSTGGTLDLEPYLVTQSGTGASASQLGAAGIGAPSFGRPGLLLSTGTTNTGYVVVEHLVGPLLFVAGTSNYDYRAEVQLIDLPTVDEAYTLELGFFLLGSAPAFTQFMGFRVSQSSTEWRTVVTDAAGDTTPASGVTAQTATTTAMRVWYDNATAKTRYYINGTELASITDGTRSVDAFSVVRAGFILKKTAGTTARKAIVLRNSLDIKFAAIPYF